MLPRSRKAANPATGHAEDGSARRCCTGRMTAASYNKGMKFITQDNQLTIQLEGLEQIWALKRKLQIPHYAISEVDYIAQQPVMEDFKGYFRLPGTSLPWLFLAGSYKGKGEREFWYVHLKQSGVLVLTLKQDTLNYTKVKVTCTPEIAQSIADWWQERK